MFDLQTAEAQETSVLHLKDVQGELMHAKDAGGQELPVTVVVYGPGSDQYQKAQLRAQRRAMQMFKKKGAKAADSRTAEERRAETAEVLADITVSFGNLTYKGLEGRALALAVYQNPKLGFIADQVNSHAGDWANFTSAAQSA
ncbi:hypothetical protein [Comamonas sp.]|uniref:hypothetical protein n=1 Tax=Comamonas sp. TaxID=34028 RepID=UPI00258F4E11|nr:hypothetical protein [Comamonas sp.]